MKRYANLRRHQEEPVEPQDYPDHVIPEEIPEPKSWRKRLKRFALLLLALLLAITVYGAFLFGRSTSKMFGGSAWANVGKLLLPARLDGEERGRVNMLIVGNSVDDPGHPGAGLTDSIMILSLDPSGENAFTVSIPRDLYVSVPDQGYHKINEVYNIGNANRFRETGYAKDGMGLLEKVLEQRLNLKIDYHTLINYGAVRDSVNAVGGIEINLKSPDPRGVYDPNIERADGGPLRLKNGVQKLDGQTVLNLMRARNAPTPDGRVGYGFPRGDFNRSEYQRQIFAALQDKIFTAGVLFNPWKLGSVLEGISDNLKSDLEVPEARRLALIMRKIDSNEIKSESLAGKDNDLLTGYRTPEGASALVPAAGIDDYSQLQAYFDRILTQ